MVFCYKIITESPRLSACPSPRKKYASSASPIGHTPVSSVSQVLRILDYDGSGKDLVDIIPDREWRLLGALVKKKEEDAEREELADQFRRMWQKEKEEREIAEAKINKEYKRYITRKRREDQMWQDFRQSRMSFEDKQRRRQLIDSINDKEQKTADMLAWVYDVKAHNIEDKALEGHARALLAADRRIRHDQAELLRKQVQLTDAERKADDAGKRRKAILKDASQRVAINNALSSWGSRIIKQEVTAMETAWRAHHAARAALASARSNSLMRAREARTRRARQVATVTEQLRDFIRSGRK